MVCPHCLTPKNGTEADDNTITKTPQCQYGHFELDIENSNVHSLCVNDNFFLNNLVSFFFATAHIHSTTRRRCLYLDLSLCPRGGGWGHVSHLHSLALPLVPCPFLMVTHPRWGYPVPHRWIPWGYTARTRLGTPCPGQDWGTPSRDRIGSPP